MKQELSLAWQNFLSCSATPLAETQCEFPPSEILGNGGDCAVKRGPAGQWENPPGCGEVPPAGHCTQQPSKRWDNQQEQLGQCVLIPRLLKWVRDCASWWVNVKFYFGRDPTFYPCKCFSVVTWPRSSAIIMMNGWGALSVLLRIEVVFFHSSII